MFAQQCDWLTSDIAQGDLIQKLYLRLLDALYSSTILPEHAWESVTPKEQAFMLHRREAIAEALLEVAGMLAPTELLAGVHL